MEGRMCICVSVSIDERDLKELVSDGNQLKVKLDVLDRVNVWLQNVMLWQGAAQSFLSTNNLDQKSTLADVSHPIASMIPSNKAHVTQFTLQYPGHRLLL